ncbi:MAG: hypothetical protein WBH01_02645 [Dehalococcoidia bacterium]
MPNVTDGYSVIHLSELETAVEGSTESEAGHHIQVVAAYLARGVGGTIIIFHEESSSSKYITPDSCV